MINEKRGAIAILQTMGMGNNEIFKMRIYELPVKKQRFRWTGFTKYGEKAPSGVYSASIVQGKKSVTRKFKLIN